MHDEMRRLLFVHYHSISLISETLCWHKRLKSKSGRVDIINIISIPYLSINEYVCHIIFRLSLTIFNA